MLHPTRGSIIKSTSLLWPTLHCRDKLVMIRWIHDSLLGLGWGILLLLLSWLGWGWLGSLNNWLWLLLNWSWLTTHLDDLAGDSLLLTDGVLGTTGLTLSLDLSNTDLLGLHLVDSLHQDVLVLELVTLGSQVELVVEVLVDFLAVTVLSEETTENASTADGKNLAWHTGIRGTLLVTSTLMTALSLLSFVLLYTRARVHLDLASDDEAVLEHFSDVLA